MKRFFQTSCFPPKMGPILFGISLLFVFISHPKIARAQTMSLGNTIWWDVNNNGIQDSGEPRAESIQVHLYQDNNNDGVADLGFTSISTYTNSSGRYNFTSLAPGSYFVVVDPGWGYYRSTVSGGDPDNNIDRDNNGFFQSGSDYKIYSQTITLTENEEPDGTGAVNTNTNNTCDFGIWKGNGLGDQVWLDNNGNGIYEGGEPGLANVTVRLKDNSGNVLATTVTDANGKYFFYDPVQYGVVNYQLEFITPAGYLPTTGNTGSDDEKDSDAVSGIISGVYVPIGEWNNSFDAGFVPAPTILPVKLTSFDAWRKEKNIQLRWTSVSEFNTDRFIVERSTDGIHYSDEAIVFAKGAADTETTYQFTDDITSLQVPVVYYRLCMLDKNGSMSRSSVKIVRLEDQAVEAPAIRLFPNPVIHEMNITIPDSWMQKQIAIDVYNAGGVVVARLNSSGFSQLEILRLDKLSPGYYIVKARCGEQSVTQKIIKQ